MLALPHEVVPLQATTNALSLNLYVKSSETRRYKSQMPEGIGIHVLPWRARDGLQCHRFF